MVGHINCKHCTFLFNEFDINLKMFVLRCFVINEEWFEKVKRITENSYNLLYGYRFFGTLCESYVCCLYSLLELNKHNKKEIPMSSIQSIRLTWLNKQKKYISWTNVWKLYNRILIKSTRSTEVGSYNL